MNQLILNNSLVLVSLINNLLVVLVDGVSVEIVINDERSVQNLLRSINDLVAFEAYESEFGSNDDVSEDEYTIDDAREHLEFLCTSMISRLSK